MTTSQIISWSHDMSLLNKKGGCNQWEPPPERDSSLQNNKNKKIIFHSSNRELCTIAQSQGKSERLQAYKRQSLNNHTNFHRSFFVSCILPAGSGCETIKRDKLGARSKLVVLLRERERERRSVYGGKEDPALSQKESENIPCTGASPPQGIIRHLAATVVANPSIGMFGGGRRKPELPKEANLDMIQHFLTQTRIGFNSAPFFTYPNPTLPIVPPCCIHHAPLRLSTMDTHYIKAC